MRWSKLKQNLEDRLADSLKDRLAIYATQYRADPNLQGIAWISFDGREVWRFEFPRTAGATEATGTPERTAEIESGVNASESGPERQRRLGNSTKLSGHGIESQSEFYQLLMDLLSLSIDDALASDHSLIRGLAMIDRRLGKRRLRRLDLETESPLVRQLYRLRCEAEGMSSPGTSVAYQRN